MEIYTEDEDAPEDTAVKTPLIRMTGANLQIVNQAEAQTTPDGTGNLVVGLAEERDFNVSGIDGEACSDGLIENAADCIGADETWSISHNTGSHNIVGGQQPAYSQTGGLVVGENNLINRTNANVTGGQLNIASGLRATVGGGSANTANSSNSTVSGGSRNTASGSASSVSGGRNNTASSSDSVVSGGWLNTASGARSTVGGGIKSTLGDNEGCEVDDFNEWGASPSTGGALGDCAE